MNILAILAKQPFMKMFFKKKRSNKGVMWASLLSLGATAAVWGMRKGKKGQKGQKGNPADRPVQNAFSTAAKSMSIPNINIPNMSDAALAEFSEELINKATTNTADNQNKKEF